MSTNLYNDENIKLVTYFNGKNKVYKAYIKNISLEIENTTDIINRD